MSTTRTTSTNRDGSEARDQDQLRPLTLAEAHAALVARNIQLPPGKVRRLASDHRRHGRGREVGAFVAAHLADDRSTPCAERDDGGRTSYRDPTGNAAVGRVTRGAARATPRSGRGLGAPHAEPAVTTDTATRQDNDCRFQTSAGPSVTGPGHDRPAHDDGRPVEGTPIANGVAAQPTVRGASW